MFSTANFIRLALSRLRPPRSAFRLARVFSAAPRNHRIIPLPNYIAPSLAFSLFTWLGFDKEATPEDELIMSIKYCVLFIQRNEFDKAERLLHVALRQAQQMAHEKAITYIYDVMANLALQRGQNDKAKDLFVSVAQRLMQAGVTEDDLKIIHISLKLARISHLRKEFQTAQTGYEWCMDKLNKQFAQNPSEEINKLLAMSEDWYGKLYVDCNQKEKGLQMLLSSHERTQALSDFNPEHRVIQLNDIATVYEQLNQFNESESYLRDAIKLGTSLDMKADLGVIYVNLGRVLLKKGLINEARKACGYAVRLAYEAKSEEVEQQASKCIKEINSA